MKQTHKKIPHSSESVCLPLGDFEWFHMNVVPIWKPDRNQPIYLILCFLIDAFRWFFFLLWFRFAEEVVTKKKTELTTTRHIETRVKRQIVLEDGKVIEDSGPIVETNTTEDTNKQESESVEVKMCNSHRFISRLINLINLSIRRCNKKNHIACIVFVYVVRFF